MNAPQPELDFDAVSEPITGETRATVALVGGDWRADEDWRRFVAACEYESNSLHGYSVNPNDVRKRLTIDGELSIAPRRLSAFWSRATGKKGFLDNTDEWTVNNDHKGGNAGKPIRLRRLRSP
jgi:hypothetical protein